MPCYTYSIPLKDVSAWRALTVTGAWTRGLPAEGRSRYSLHHPWRFGVSPDSSSEMRAFPHLIVWHDIERVPVQGEGHVPEDGAAILHHGHCLVLHSALQKTVHSDLQETRTETETKRQWMAQHLNGYCTFVEWHLLSAVYLFVCFIRFLLHLCSGARTAPAVPPKHSRYEKMFFKCQLDKKWGKTACFQFQSLVSFLASNGYKTSFFTCLAFPFISVRREA